MFTNRSRAGRNDWPGGMPLAMMSLMAGAIVLSVIACGSGVSAEELKAVTQELETEKTHSQTLQSELAMEKAGAARRVEAADRLEARIAEVESQLSKERASVAKRQESVDKAEARATLLAAFLAWNRKDRDGFIASFTENGIAETSLSVPVMMGDPPIALRRVMEADVSGDTATIHAMFALGTHRNSVRYSMAKLAGVWKIQGEERLSPKVHGDTLVLNLKLDGCSRLSESEFMIDRKLALSVENSGPERPHLILKRVPQEIDPELLLQDDGTPPKGVRDVAFVRGTKAGESINVAFTEPLQTGRYVLVCYTGAEDAGGDPLPEGIVAEFTVK